MRFLYFYFLKDDPERVRALTPEHAAYWRGLALSAYLGGPFADRSGGMISFGVHANEEAEDLASNDPFRRQDLVDSSWLKTWLHE